MDAAASAKMVGDIGTRDRMAEKRSGLECTLDIGSASAYIVKGVAHL